MVRATLRASRSQIAGIGLDADGRSVLAVRIAGPPSEGAANAALTDLLAAELGIRKRDVVIHRGETGRNKQVHVAGDAMALIARLEALNGG
ncbi:MAG: DUF167 domain-containing protein [Blastomonas fulva]